MYVCVYVRVYRYGSRYISFNNAEGGEPLLLRDMDARDAFEIKVILNRE